MKYFKKYFLNTSYVLGFLILTNACWQVEKQDIVFTGWAPEFPGSRTLQIEGKIIDLTSPVLQFGHCYATHPLPTINDQLTNLGETNEPGSMLSIVSGLLPETFYFIRGYMIKEDKVVYGNVLSVQTSPEFVVKDFLSVFTDGNSNIEANQAVAKGRMSSNEPVAIQAYGHCWSTQKERANLIDAEGFTDLIKPGTNLELEDFLRFESTITSLNPGTTYYYRAYASTFDGQTLYGELKSFPTTR